MTHPNIDHDVLALGVKQPWAELILRGIKTIEVRSQDTSVRGRIYLYASKRVSEIEPALDAARQHQLDLSALPYGLLVGSVEIVGSTRCRPADADAAAVPRAYLDGHYAWHLRNPKAFPNPLPVRFLPYGVWFYPFKRRGSRRDRQRRGE
jgi:hypothetical protein